MALYLDGARYALYNSADLKDWRHLCDVELPGALGVPRFLFRCRRTAPPTTSAGCSGGANGSYLVGRFDGCHLRAGRRATALRLERADLRRPDVERLAGGRWPAHPDRLGAAGHARDAF